MLSGNADRVATTAFSLIIKPSPESHLEPGFGPLCCSSVKGKDANGNDFIGPHCNRFSYRSGEPLWHIMTQTYLLQCRRTPIWNFRKYYSWKSFGKCSSHPFIQIMRLKHRKWNECVQGCTILVIKILHVWKDVAFLWSKTFCLIQDSPFLTT